VSSIPDFVVVGGGVIGCAVAYELARRSARILLLDKSLPGRATSASAGGLWPIGEAVGLGCGVIFHAARVEGQPADSAGPTPLPAAFRDFLVASNARFPELAGELHDRTGINIEFAPGAGLLFLAYDERQRCFAQAVQRSLPTGMRLELLSREEVIRLEPHLTPHLLGAALLTGEHQVNPMLLARAFQQAAVRQGASFRPGARVTALRRRGNRIVGVELDNEFVPCGMVINAAGAWAGQLATTGGMKLPVFPVRGQIVLTEALPPVLHACVSTAACYLAQKRHGEMLIGSTTERAGFDVAVTAAALVALCRGARRAVPLLGRVGIKRTWAGLRPGTPDELPVLGPVAGLDGYVNATGGFRTGIVAAPLTGQVVAQVACGETPSLGLETFSAQRFGAPEGCRPATGAPGRQCAGGLTPARA
jgi:glycine/D-amino acid oxidase-like deaminating enzyme